MNYRLGIGNKWDDESALAERLRLLKEGQAMPLLAKVGKTDALIFQVLNERRAEECYLAFSGGMDSAVVADRIEKVDNEHRIEFVFENTNLEFTETIDYVHWWEREFGRKIHMTVPFEKPINVWKQYGYPLFSKRLATMSSQPDNPTIQAMFAKAGLSHVLTSGVKLSDKCCELLKHGPGQAYATQRGFKVFFSGMRAEESRDRRRNWLTRGCYYPVKSGADRVWPIAFWTHQDVLDYHKLVGLPHAALYDKGFTRNGCRLCGFGCHIAKPNKFELLAEHYPKFWRESMERFGLFDVCEKLGIRDGRNILTPWWPS